ncbi:L-lactate permease [Pseudarthrobacter sp. TAF60_1]|uniref:L-lactate permease n=1 Tax=Pseudarthrobacter sp. TAF60_1 TaxID=3233071 RepID=UPI003F97D9EF
MFEQILAPVGESLVLSALLAATPLAVLFVLLGVFRVKAHKAALTSLVLSMLTAVFVWQMPVSQLLSATGEGILYGLIPILWILMNALWIYKLTVVSGWFEVLGARIRRISNDQRVLAIIIAFCFGALLESLAGFGAPVAISAAMLMAAGMKPLKSALVSLLANTAPVAFGSMAAPIVTLAAVTGIDMHTLSQMAGRQTPFVAVIVPLILVFLVDGRRGLRETWKIALVAGLVFGLAQFLTANYIAAELTDIVASVATIPAVLLALRWWKPKTELVFEEAGTDSRIAPLPGAGTVHRGMGATLTEVPQSTRRSTFLSVMPYLVIITVFAVSQIPAIKSWLSSVGSVTFAWPGLNVTDASGKAVAAQTFKLEHLKATGTLLLISGIIVTASYKISFRQALTAYKDTLVQLRFTIVTVMSVLGLSFVMNLSGQTASLGFALASAGGLFILFSPVIGWLGVAITGSDTSSNSLFGLLQVTVAGQAGLDPVLAAATNSSAGVLGKMLSPQNLAVAAAAVGLAGREGDIFRKLIGWSLALLVLFTALVFLQSTPILGWMVP